MHGPIKMCQTECSELSKAKPEWQRVLSTWESRSGKQLHSLEQTGRVEAVAHRAGCGIGPKAGTSAAKCVPPVISLPATAACNLYLANVMSIVLLVQVSLSATATLSASWTQQPALQQQY